jgi:hypothetical protein
MIRNEVGTCKVLLHRQSTTYYHATQSGCYMSWCITKWPRQHIRTISDCLIHVIFFNNIFFILLGSLEKRPTHLFVILFYFFAGSHCANSLDLKRIPESSKVGTFLYNNFAVLSFFLSNDLIYYKPQKRTRLRWRKTAEICCHQGVVVVFSSIST